MNPTRLRGPEASAKRLFQLLERLRSRGAELPSPPREPPKPKEHGRLEALTWDFRHGLEEKHRARVREQHDAYRAELDAWDPTVLGAPSEVSAIPLRKALSSRLWHERRARGQRFRFERVRACGKRVLIAHCRAHGHECKPTPEGCLVTRVCLRCALFRAKERRARYGRSRARVLIEGERYHLTDKSRPGGRFGEKMLTLTIPDALVPGETEPEVLTNRVAILFAAWTFFARSTRAYWKRQGALLDDAPLHHRVKHHRAFEWTPGADELGHPHFHLWLWAPWIDAREWHELWGYAIEDAAKKLGLASPMVRRAPEPGEVIGQWNVSLKIQAWHDFDGAAVVELLKGGKKGALQLSRRGSSPLPSSAVEYAEGWTIAEVMGRVPDETIASLYQALEGRRLTQASKGFFVEEPAPQCMQCAPFERERFCKDHATNTLVRAPNFQVYAWTAPDGERMTPEWYAAIRADIANQRKGERWDTS